jgi:hypothetical protein
MTRSVRRLVAAFVVGTLALALGMNGTAEAQGKKEDKVPAIDEVMKKVCSKKGSVAKVTAAAKDGK